MWFFSKKCQSDTQLAGKTAIITGGNTGIGKETAKEFYKRGARVIIACRDTEKANGAIEDIERECEELEGLGSLHARRLDLASLSAVRQSALEILEGEERIDLLVNNAGMICSSERLTEDALETTFVVNHLGHFLFTLLLLPRLVASAPARIVNVSSVAHTRGTIDFDDLHFEKRPYNHIAAYAQSKLANILFTKELARRLQGKSDVTVYSVHPGIVHTELGRNMSLIFPGLRTLWRLLAGWTLKTPEQGAQTTIHCALDEEAGKETGLYYSECQVTEPIPEAEDLEVANKLWDVSIKLAGLENYDPFKPE